MLTITQNVSSDILITHKVNAPLDDRLHLLLRVASQCGQLLCQPVKSETQRGLNDNLRTGNGDDDLVPDLSYPLISAVRTWHDVTCPQHAKGFQS